MRVWYLAYHSHYQACGLYEKILKSIKAMTCRSLTNSGKPMPLGFHSQRCSFFRTPIPFIHIMSSWQQSQEYIQEQNFKFLITSLNYFKKKTHKFNYNINTIHKCFQQLILFLQTKMYTRSIWISYHVFLRFRARMQRKIREY